MPQYIAEKTMLLQLLERHEWEIEPDVMSREFVKGAKWTSYYADTRRLNLNITYQAAAANRHAKTVLSRGKPIRCCVQLHWSATTLLLH